MITEATVEQILPKLKTFDTFDGISEEALLWLAKKSECLTVPIGSEVFTAGEAANYMIMLVEGEYVVKFTRQGKEREVGTSTDGQITGVLPFSRMHTIGATATATKDCHLLMLHKDHFVEMVNVSYELTQALVAVMTERVRNFQQLQLSNEKMMALGKMSAGLAHELNNPAAAIVRASEVLYDHMHQTPEGFKEVITMPVTPEQVDQVNKILFDKINGFADVDLSLMEREEMLDDIIDWLDDKDIERSEEVADNLVDFAFDAEALDQVASILPGEALASVLKWIETNLITERLVVDIRTSGERIANLVSSIKSYTHMDREPSFEVIDIVHGLKSTLTILKHRFKKQKVELDKQISCELAKVRAIPGEMNQVWTNLLANALDVLPDGGKIKIRTFTERGYVCLEIEDNGPGIPEEIQRRVFEPFFTTKAVGEGTGMGLDIVKRIVDRHQGLVSVESVTGRTCFRTCLPIYKA
ncbi:MAG: ATP-binding protein [Bacteroidota bacterium]